MWFDSLYFESLFSLFLAAILGGVVGFERAGKNHDAGLRTHILVCVGSATVMILSKYLHNYYNIGDISRMGAQVISGIGFLGMGSIIITGDRIRGITTAAGLWTTACVGLVVGMGYYHIAITVVIFMIVAILGLRPIAHKVQSKYNEERMISISVKGKDSFNDLFKVLTDVEINTLSVNLDERGTDGEIRAIFDLSFGKTVDKNDLAAKLSAIKGISEIDFM